MNEPKFKRGDLAKANTVTEMKPFTDRMIPMEGRVFGKLKVLKYLGVNYKRDTVWQCLCDCGNICQSGAQSLRKQGKQSCGCITIIRINQENIINSKKRIKRAEEIGLNRFIKTCKYGAVSRGFTYELDSEFTYSMIKKKCYYCGIEHSNKMNLGHDRIFTYNGLDRIENSMNYTVDNVVTCCKTCNRMKSDMELGEFCEYVTRLVDHSKNWIKS